jgi:hypothetical protein
MLGLTLPDPIDPRRRRMMHLRNRIADLKGARYRKRLELDRADAARIEAADELRELDAEIEHTRTQYNQLAASND